VPNDRHHRVAGVDFDYRTCWPPPLRCMAWFVQLSHSYSSAVSTFASATASWTSGSSPCPLTHTVANAARIAHVTAYHSRCSLAGIFPRGQRPIPKSGSQHGHRVQHVTGALVLHEHPQLLCACPKMFAPDDRRDRIRFINCQGPTDLGGNGFAYVLSCESYNAFDTQVTVVRHALDDCASMMSGYRCPYWTNV
jgi:hypothetical protein